MNTGFGKNSQDSTVKLIRFCIDRLVCTVVRMPYATQAVPIPQQANSDESYLQTSRHEEYSRP